jgi:protein-S-isoprenylcysteine O-methyltransferase Ste14
VAITALLLFVAFLVLTAGVRVWIQVRRTGDTGDRRAAARRHPVQRRIDAVAAVGAVALGVASPVAALLGVEPVPHGRWLSLSGVVLVVVGTVATFAAQLAMGESWRAGVDPQERTALVTTGPFALVRNPVLSAVLVTCLGLSLMVPTVIGLAGLVFVVVANELLVRMVEEPHLRRVHGEEYTRYAAAVGRFVPGVGRLRPSPQPPGGDASTT